MSTSLKVLRPGQNLLQRVRTAAIYNNAARDLVGAKRFYADEPPDTSPAPICSKQEGKEKTCGKIKDVVCGEKVKKAVDTKKKDDDFQFHHLLKWPPECCADPCAEEFPRFDDCLYKSSDKATRIYQQTWVECPDIQIKPKKICCFEKGIPPQIPRRKKAPKGSACKVEEKPCINTSGECPKIKMPGCRPVAESVRCKRTRYKTLCEKVRAPYPSFSECTKPTIRGKRRTECECLVLPPRCVINKILVEMEKTGKNPLKCP